MDSYDIRFWDIMKTGNGSAARYRVRWAVNGREHCKSFKARPLADGFPWPARYSCGAREEGPRANASR